MSIPSLGYQYIKLDELVQDDRKKRELTLNASNAFLAASRSK